MQAYTIRATITGISQFISILLLLVCPAFFKMLFVLRATKGTHHRVNNMRANQCHRMRHACDRIFLFGFSAFFFELVQYS